MQRPMMGMITLVFVAASLVAAGCAGGPSRSEPEEYTKAFVAKAIERYQNEGLGATVVYYNSMESVDGPWYMFILDGRDIFIAHATLPENVGMDLKGPVGIDVTGYDFGAEMVTATEDGKLVSYQYLNPSTGNVESKHAWVVRHDGLLFGSGWYSDPESYTKALVNKAIERYKNEGLDATVAYHKSMESVDGAWYVFILDENYIIISHPTRPERIGIDVSSPDGTDVTGYHYGAEMITATEEGKLVSYQYLNPSTGNIESKDTWIVRHDGLLFASGWYTQ